MPLAPAVTERLLFCANQGPADELKEFLAQFPDAVHATNEHGCTFLHAAAAGARASLCAHLVEACPGFQKADGDAADRAGLTALHYAAHSGDLETVEYLVRRSVVRGAPGSGTSTQAPDSPRQCGH